MSIQKESKIFGTVLRTKILTAIALLEETFPSELARLLQARLYSVQRILEDFEQEGILASRKPGVERRITLNPRYYFYMELKSLLTRMGEQDHHLMQALMEKRARPRRRSKALTGKC